MRPGKILVLLACLAGLPLPGCQTVPGTSLPTAEDVRECEAVTRRILATPCGDRAFVRTVYTPELARRILRGMTPQAGTGLPVLNYDYVYDTQSEDPDVLRVGPAFIAGSRVEVPVVMQSPGEPPQTKYWTFVARDGGWRAAEITDPEGRRLSEILP
jgi:hypothetical protein